MIQLYEICLTCSIFPDICHGGKNECKKVKEWKEKENKIMKYRKKPVIIEAYELKCLSRDCVYGALKFMDRENEMSEFIDKDVNPTTDYLYNIQCNNGIMIQTLEGDMLATRGDYIIKGVNGEFYPCKPDIFEKTYDRVNEEELINE